MRKLEEKSILFRKTGGFHAAALATPKSIIPNRDFCADF